MSYADALKSLSKRNSQIIIKLVGLPKKYEQVLIYRYVDELSVFDIATRMCLSPDSIDSLMTKARKRFNTIIKNEYYLYDSDERKFIDLVRGKQ